MFSGDNKSDFILFYFIGAKISMCFLFNICNYFLSLN